MQKLYSCDDPGTETAPPCKATCDDRSVELGAMPVGIVAVACRRLDRSTPAASDGRDNEGRRRDRVWAEGAAMIQTGTPSGMAAARARGGEGERPGDGQPSHQIGVVRTLFPTDLDGQHAVPDRGADESTRSRTGRSEERRTTPKAAPRRDAVQLRAAVARLGRPRRSEQRSCAYAHACSQGDHPGRSARPRAEATHTRKGRMNAHTHTPTDNELAEVDRANASGKQPVVFVLGCGCSTPTGTGGLRSSRTLGMWR